MSIFLKIILYLALILGVLWLIAYISDLLKGNGSNNSGNLGTSIGSSVVSAVDGAVSGAWNQFAGDTNLDAPGQLISAENLGQSLDQQIIANQTKYAPGGSVYNNTVVTKGQDAADADWAAVQQHDVTMQQDDEPWYESFFGMAAAL